MSEKPDRNVFEEAKEGYISEQARDYLPFLGRSVKELYIQRDVEGFDY